jgi:hypothetical protein
MRTTSWRRFWMPHANMGWRCNWSLEQTASPRDS